MSNPTQICKFWDTVLNSRSCVPHPLPPPLSVPLRTFGPGQSHDERRIGLVQLSETRLSRMVPDDGELLQDDGLERLFLGTAGLTL